MTSYLDTSVLVAALTDEPGSPDAQAWLASRPSGDLHTSDWTRTEFHAAIALKQRTRQIDTAEAERANSSFARLLVESLAIVEVNRSDFLLSARLIVTSKAALRAGDALHLAVASARQDRLVTLDRKLAEAATAIGVRTELLLKPTRAVP